MPTYHVLLSLNLPEVSQSQRNTFNERLGENGWLKIDGVDTVWYKANSGSDENTVRIKVVADLERAAESSRSDVVAVFQVGNNKYFSTKINRSAGITSRLASKF